MKNKKGFTLIELLAVIVILAIIALIATPIVMNVIENSRKGAAERSAENYLSAVETAIATGRLDGPVTDGTYEVDGNGDLVLQTDNTIKIEVEVSGNAPASGTIIVIVNGVVDKTQVTIIIGDYKVTDEDEDGKLEAEESEGEVVVAKICTYKGTDETQKYAYGAEYECNLGDGTARTFYVLENGDKTELKKGDGSYHTDAANPGIGTTGDNEVSLIMDRNIDDTKLGWCGDETKCKKDGNWSSGFGPITALSYLREHTSNWTNEQILGINLPTYKQIYNINNTTENFPEWLRTNLRDTDKSLAYGYWLSTADNRSSNTAFGVYYYPEGKLASYGVSSTAYYGVRPVITVAKENLK